jgi:hypothetical protein
MIKVVMSLKDGGGLYMEEFSRHRAEEAFSFLTWYLCSVGSAVEKQLTQ